MSDSDCEIRPAHRSDVEAIVALLADDELGRQRERLTDPLPAAYLDAFDEIDASPVHELVVAVHGAQIIGVLQLSFLRHLTYQGGLRAQIEGVRVAADARGRRVGEQLFRWAIARAEAAGAHLVQLTTDARRGDAHRFYERLGFQATHTGMKLHLASDTTRPSILEPR